MYPQSYSSSALALERVCSQMLLLARFSSNSSLVILLIRIWVVWGKSLWLTICLPAFFVVTWIGIGVVSWYFVASAVFHCEYTTLLASSDLPRYLLNNTYSPTSIYPEELRQQVQC